MKDKGIKLTEKQLAELFQNNSKKHTASSDAHDCYAATAASSTRLSHVEDLISDHDSAQAMKGAMALKDWSHVMADAIENSRRSWFSFLGMETPLKTSVATLAFAFAMVVAIPEISQLNQQNQTNIPMPQNMAHGDVINAIEFETNTDRLSKGGFDVLDDRIKSDGLFSGSFG